MIIVAHSCRTHMSRTGWYILHRLQLPANTNHKYINKKMAMQIIDKYVQHTLLIYADVILLDALYYHRDAAMHHRRHCAFLIASTVAAFLWTLPGAPCDPNPSPYAGISRCSSGVSRTGQYEHARTRTNPSQSQARLWHTGLNSVASLSQDKLGAPKHRSPTSQHRDHRASK